MTTIRLVLAGGSQESNVFVGNRGVKRLPLSAFPALLTSYAYLDSFLKNRDRIAMRDWVMDSGAFTAHASGKAVDLNKYIATCQELLATDPKLTEVFALDVIGDHKATLKNTERMWKEGVPAIPTFHVGEPMSYLRHLKKHYPKIALGGAVGYKARLDWAKGCFGEIWPHRVHGFGFGDPKLVMALPWDSVDASSWELGPCRFGNWKSFNNAALRIRGSGHNLRSEIEFYLKVERQARSRWGPVFAAAKLDMGQADRLTHNPHPGVARSLEPVVPTGSTRIREHKQDSDVDAQPSPAQPSPA